MVVDGDPACDCDCVLGSLGMFLLDFRTVTPQDGTTLLSCNQSGSQVHELRQGFAGYWPKGGTDVPCVGLDGGSGRVFWVSLSGPKTPPSLDILPDMTDSVGKVGAAFVTLRDPGGDPIWEILGRVDTPQGGRFGKPSPISISPPEGPSWLVAIDLVSFGWECVTLRGNFCSSLVLGVPLSKVVIVSSRG